MRLQPHTENPSQYDETEHYSLISSSPGFLQSLGIKLRWQRRQFAAKCLRRPRKRKKRLLSYNKSQHANAQYFKKCGSQNL